MHYPRDVTTVAWGPVIGLAVLAALGVARAVGSAPAAFGCAFVAYELVLAAYSAFHGSLADFSAPIVWSVFVGNVVGLLVLGAACAIVAVAERLPNGLSSARR